MSEQLDILSVQFIGNAFHPFDPLENCGDHYPLPDILENDPTLRPPRSLLNCLCVFNSLPRPPGTVTRLGMRMLYVLSVALGSLSSRRFDSDVYLELLNPPDPGDPYRGMRSSFS
jgi:hypothetical protein